MTARMQQYGLKIASRLCGMALSSCIAFTAVAQEASPETAAFNPTAPHMAEALRADVHKLVVIAGEAPPSESVTGSYEKETAGLLGGMEEGSRIGTISKEIGGVPVNIPIPVIGTLGSIYGGLSGAAKREIQEFRDTLTEELVNADSPPLRSDGLALDAFWTIRRLPHIDSHLFAATTPIDGDTDSILYVSLDGVTIDVQEDEAIITATATATLRRLSDGRNVYETVIRYQDRDNLKNWTANDNALWRAYTQYARYYLGRELAADVFARVVLNHDLKPLETDTARVDRKNERRFMSEVSAPSLAWELQLKGGDSYGPWTESLDESVTSWDIVIFDERELVYYERDLPDPSHMLYYELEPCKTYRWSVRPMYKTGEFARFGEWMRYASTVDEDVVAGKGLAGREASVAHALVQDFPVLEIACPR
jgi:hypothetical protein